MQTFSEHPLSPALIRLNDSYKHWCQARTYYFSPNDFRLAINACITTLRSVTNVLQKQKSNILNFDDWYTKWQETLKQDPILRWSVKARNQILKEGDLRLNSKLRISIVASYYDSPYEDFLESPFTTTEEILRKIKYEKIPDEIFKHGFLRLERRWAADSLSDYELLDALSHCYSTLSLLLYDCWNNIENSKINPPLSNGLLPCMVRSEDERSIWVRLSTGMIESIQEKRISLQSSAKQKEAFAWYGNPEFEMPLGEEISLTFLANKFYSLAKTILLKDKYHDLLVFLILPSNKIELIVIKPENQGDKYHIWREIALQVKRTDSIGVISIGEVWIGQNNPNHPFAFACEIENRSEALLLTVISKDGEEFVLLTPFIRGNDEIILQKTIEEKPDSVFFLEPIREVWKSRKEK